MEIFEAKYKDGLSREDAIEMALGIMNEVTERKLSESTIEMALIELPGKEFRKLSPEEVKDHVAKVIKEAPKGEE